MSSLSNGQSLTEWFSILNNHSMTTTKDVSLHFLPEKMSIFTGSMMWNYVSVSFQSIDCCILGPDIYIYTTYIYTYIYMNWVWIGWNQVTSLDCILCKHLCCQNTQLKNSQSCTEWLEVWSSTFVVGGKKYPLWFSVIQLFSTFSSFIWNDEWLSLAHLPALIHSALYPS